MQIDSREFAKTVVEQYLPEAKSNTIGTDNLATIIRDVFASGVAYGTNQTRSKVATILASEWQSENLESKLLQEVLESLPSSPMQTT